MALVNAFDDPEKGSKAAAVLALIGFVNVPIIKFSVDWWNTLHQPASLSRLTPSNRYFYAHTIIIDGSGVQALPYFDFNHKNADYID